MEDMYSLQYKYLVVTEVLSLLRRCLEGVWRLLYLEDKYVEIGGSVFWRTFEGSLEGAWSK